MNVKEIFLWILQLLAVFILAQSLFFKFSGAEESIYIFTVLGMEPWGRILIGITELIAVVFLLIPRLAATGALLSFGVMLGAVLGHLTKLGIVVQDDGGLLFYLALAVLVCTATVAYGRRKSLPLIGDQMD